MAPKSIKLVYFNMKGRAELVRWVLAEAGWDYEDKRVGGGDWKADAPYGQLPYMEVDGVKLCETVAMATFVASQVGLMGDSPVETAQSQMVALMANECLSKMGQAMMAKDETQKKELMEKLKTEHTPKFLNFVLKMKGAKPWIVGKKMSFADLAFAWYIDIWAQEARDQTKKAMPEVIAHYEKVIATPKIKGWIAKRPVTEH